MRRYRFLILAIVAGILALGMSTTSFCMDMSRTMEIVLFEDTGVRVTAPIYAIREMAYRDKIPSEWPLFADEQSILDATNGLIGPLLDDPLRAGVLRYYLQPIIRTRKAGSTPALFISPDGMTVKFMAVIAFDDGINCDLTTLQFNNNKIWPKYLQIDHQYYLKILSVSIKRAKGHGDVTYSAYRRRGPSPSRFPRNLRYDIVRSKTFVGVGVVCMRLR